jgi:hypothetical protein
MTCFAPSNSRCLMHMTCACMCVLCVWCTGAPVTVCVCVCVCVSVCVSVCVRVSVHVPVRKPRRMDCFTMASL